MCGAAKRALDSGAGAPAEAERERRSERWRFSHSSVGAGEERKEGEGWVCVRLWVGGHDGNKTYVAAQILNKVSEGKWRKTCLCFLLKHKEAVL